MSARIKRKKSKKTTVKCNSTVQFNFNSLTFTVRSKKKPYSVYLIFLVPLGVLSIQLSQIRDWLFISNTFMFFNLLNSVYTFLIDLTFYFFYIIFAAFISFHFFCIELFKQYTMKMKMKMKKTQEKAHTIKYFLFIFFLNWLKFYSIQLIVAETKPKQKQKLKQKFLT